MCAYVFYNATKPESFKFYICWLTTRQTICFTSLVELVLIQSFFFRNKNIKYSFSFSFCLCLWLCVSIYPFSLLFIEVLKRKWAMTYSNASTSRNIESSVKFFQTLLFFPSIQLYKTITVIFYFSIWMSV